MAYSDRELLARLIECEAGGEGDNGMRAVASVVMNTGPKITTSEEPGITMPMKQVMAQTAITVPSLPKFQPVMMAPISSATFRSPNREPII